MGSKSLYGAPEWPTLRLITTPALTKAGKDKVSSSAQKEQEHGVLREMEWPIREV